MKNLKSIVSFIVVCFILFLSTENSIISNESDKTVENMEEISSSHLLAAFERGLGKVEETEPIG